jgi:hypothetical protein
MGYEAFVSAQDGMAYWRFTDDKGSVRFTAHQAFELLDDAVADLRDLFGDVDISLPAPEKLVGADY